MTTEVEIGAAQLSARNAIDGQRQKLEEAGRILPCKFQKGHSPADTLISDFRPPAL